MTSQKIAIGLVAVALFVGSMTAHGAAAPEFETPAGHQDIHMLTGETNHPSPLLQLVIPASNH